MSIEYVAEEVGSIVKSDSFDPDNHDPETSGKTNSESCLGHVLLGRKVRCKRVTG